MESMHGSPMNEVAKTKVTKAEIITRTISNKPYFEIKYITLDEETHIGYGSYDLNNVLEWKQECFEIIND